MHIIHDIGIPSKKHQDRSLLSSVLPQDSISYRQWRSLQRKDEESCVHAYCQQVIQYVECT